MGGGAGLEGKQMLGLGGTPEQGWEWVSQAERRLRKSIGHDSLRAGNGAQKVS